MTAPLRICIIASSRFPVAEPFAGGLEAHTHQYASELIRRGHEVTLFAGPGSDPSLGARMLTVDPFEPSDTAINDVGAWPRRWMQEHHAYLRLMMELSRSSDFDLVHNNSLHHLPVAMAAMLPVPMVTTLHTPPVPWLESAIQVAGRDSTFVAVSQAVAASWSHAISAAVIPNGVDVERWQLGPGGDRAVWTGRIVPEKGLHLAVDAALAAGWELDIAGPIGDESYFASEIRPRLGTSAHYRGHLPHDQLRVLVAGAGVALVTPRWDEPYGLVAAEAMACGTPVAAFDRGALREIVDGSSGRLAPADDVAALARAIPVAAALDRRLVRARAVSTCSLGAMTDGYERLYRARTSFRSAA